MSNDNCPPNCANCLNEELLDHEEVVDPDEEEEMDDGDSLFVSEEE